MSINRDEAIEITIGEKQYTMLPLCTFDDVKSEVHAFKFEKIENSFGLRELHNTRELYEIVDQKKYMLAKIKYGI